MLQENGELAAYLRILPEGSVFEETAIGRVMVRESQRGHGFAETILKAAMEFVWQQGKSAIRISAQQYLIDFYRGLGFQIVSDGYLEDGIPHIDMLCRCEEGNESNAPS